MKKQSLKLEKFTISKIKHPNIIIGGGNGDYTQDPTGNADDDDDRYEDS